MQRHTETELKFIVPAASRASFLAELSRGATGTERVTLVAMYLDTPDRRLARAGIAWRLRREGRRWVQTVKGAGRHPLERFEHEVPRPGPVHNASLHEGTPIGDRLAHVLRDARRDGVDVGVRFRTEVRRTIRRIRTRGAVVEMAFDEGRLVAGESSLPILEAEFELVAGRTGPMLALADRWRDRHGLIYDPRSKAERGDRLADGLPFPQLRKGSRPVMDHHATALEAFGAVLDECLGHVTLNAIGLVQGDPAQRVDHVHQLRVGLRRLRSALRSFEGWVPQPPEPMVQGLRSLFAALGAVRDSDVLDSGVAAELERAGAPKIVPRRQDAAPQEPADIVASSTAQAALMACLTWRLMLAEAPPQEEEPGDDPAAFRRGAQRRLRRWHQRIAEDWQVFETLDETQLHELRKRVKRQRYAVEFFASVLDARSVERYLKVLAVPQERMGELNDLFVARARYQALAEADPAAWFGLGWITARIEAVRSLVHVDLGRLAQADPPSR